MVDFLLEDGPMAPPAASSTLEPIPGETDVFGVYANGQWLGMVGRLDASTVSARYALAADDQRLQNLWYAKPRRGPEKSGFATAEEAQNYISQGLS